MSAVRIDHMGVIVADLDASVAKFKKLLGEGPASTKKMPDVGLRVAVFEAANIAIELLEYTDENSEFAKRVMSERRGINHFSAEVADIDAAISELTEAGFILQDGFPRDGVHGQVAFFEPDETTGLLFEICQFDRT